MPNRPSSKPAVVILVAALGALAACTSEPQRVGADRDAHGCIGSAGYAWCAREAACVRPWELSAEKGLERTEEAFRRHCAGGSGR